MKHGVAVVVTLTGRQAEAKLASVHIAVTGQNVVLAALDKVVLEL